MIVSQAAGIAMQGITEFAKDRMQIIRRLSGDIADRDDAVALQVLTGLFTYSQKGRGRKIADVI